MPRPLARPPARLLALVSLLAAALALPGQARAQTFDGSQSVDAYSGLVVGSSRVVGLAGAYAGVAEGLGGTAINPASVAHRRRDLRRSWDLDGTLSAAVLRTDQDLDNDGGKDVALSGFAHIEVGGGLQLRRLGVGVLVRSWISRGPRSDTGSAGIETGDVTISAGYSGFHDALVLGSSLTAASGAVIQYRPDGKEARRLSYGVQTYGVGGLWRPRGLPFRLGAFYNTGGRARPHEQDAAAFPGATPRSFDFPWIAALGASAWVGPNAHLYNEPAIYELRTHPEAVRDVAYDPGARSPVLLTTQLDVVGPARNAVTIASALVPGATARPSGHRPNLVPRAGAEWEPLRRWFRTRGGWYLEPSRTGGPARSHVTYGAEVRVPFWPWDLQLGFAGDAARHYTNVGLSLCAWTQRGPVPPPGPEDLQPPSGQR